MSSNPTSFRFPFATLADQPESVQQAHRAAFQGLDDLNQAVVALHKQVQAGGSGTTESVTNIQNTTVNNSLTQTLGKVNNQTGVTSYAPTNADYGAFVILNDASPISVPLTGLNTLWYATFINLGTGVATITPTSGTINGAASFVLNVGGDFTTVAFDSVNYWAAPPRTLSPVFPYTAVSATYAIGADDYLVECTANSFTATLPTAVGITGRGYIVKNSGTGTITLATTGGQTMDGHSTLTLTQWNVIRVMSNGANWLII